MREELVVKSVPSHISPPKRNRFPIQTNSEKPSRLNRIPLGAPLQSSISKHSQSFLFHPFQPSSIIANPPPPPKRGAGSKLLSLSPLLGSKKLRNSRGLDFSCGQNWMRGEGRKFDSIPPPPPGNFQKGETTKLSFLGGNWKGAAYFDS